MEQTFTPEQERFLVAKIDECIEQMMREITEVIARTEAKGDADIANAGIVITAHSPVNSHYLTAVAMESLFDKMHAGNLPFAQRILTMNAKRLGISLHVDPEE